MLTPSLTLSSTIALSSGHAVPRLGFGVAFGFGKEESSEDLTKPCTLEALKVGYRHLDTAGMYGNEKLVGEAVRASGLKREEVFITSKMTPDGDSFAAVNATLEKLEFDYIDLYLIHSPAPSAETRLALWKGLLGQKKTGKLNSAGVSNYDVHHLEEIKNAGLELPSVNQIELHPLCQQRPIVEFCRANGIAVEAYCPIIRGHLNNPAILSISKKRKREPAQILLRWSLQSGFIPLVRSSQPQRIFSNSQLYDFELSEEDMNVLNALDKGLEGAIIANPGTAP